MENEKDLLEIFQVEELEKRYEMTSWTDDSNTVQAKPVIFDAGETIETNTSAIGGQLTLRFQKILPMKNIIIGKIHKKLKL